MTGTRQSNARTANGDAASLILPGGAMVDWTLACWVRGLTVNKRFVVVGVTGAAFPVVELKRAGGVLVSRLVDDAENEGVLSSSGDFEAGWNHVALVSVSGDARLYLNGAF